MRLQKAEVSQKESTHLIGVLRFESKEARECFERVVATVHEVAHEDVVGVRHLTPRAEQLFQVIELRDALLAHTCPPCGKKIN